MSSAERADPSEELGGQECPTPVVAPAGKQGGAAVATDEEEEALCRYCFDGPEEGRPNPKP